MEKRVEQHKIKKPWPIRLDQGPQVQLAPDSGCVVYQIEGNTSKTLHLNITFRTRGQNENFLKVVVLCIKVKEYK